MLENARINPYTYVMLSLNSTFLFSIAGLLLTSLVLFRARQLRTAKFVRSAKPVRTAKLLRGSTH